MKWQDQLGLGLVWITNNRISACLHLGKQITNNYVRRPWQRWNCV